MVGTNFIHVEYVPGVTSVWYRLTLICSFGGVLNLESLMDVLYGSYGDLYGPVAV